MKEFDFIRDIKGIFPNPWENSVGNDCALFALKGNGLITKDLLVEGTHFFKDIPMKALAYKSLAVNMSDIYADGGIPEFFIVGIGAENKDQSKLKELYHYFQLFCQEWKVPIIGGDTVSSPVFFLSVTCVGSAGKKTWLRKNAREGDGIYVTGSLGSSSYGLAKIKEKGHDLSDIDIYRHLFPPLRQKATLNLNDTVNSAIDVSDGFLQDLSRLLEESKKGAEIDWEKIPRATTLPQSKKDDYSLYGGEDYELILTSSQSIDTKVFENNTGIPLTWIGKITNEQGYITMKKSTGKIEKIDIKKIKGYDHWQQKEST